MDEELVNSLFGSLKQGDIVKPSGRRNLFPDLPGVDIAIISQTCDVRNSKRKFVSIAPIVSVDKNDQSNIKKGRKPLFIAVGAESHLAANMERVISVPREQLLGSEKVGETVANASGSDASSLSNRIGRAFSRAALPDEVNIVLGKFSSKLRDKYFKSSRVAAALDLLIDIRVGCSNWNEPQRQLTLYLLLPKELLTSADFIDKDWRWGNDKIGEFDSATKKLDELDLEQIASLICDSARIETPLGMKYALWESYADHLFDQYISSELNQEVRSVEFEILSSLDFTFDEYLKTESLEFTALSDSSQRQEHG